ncbi:MAG: prephenate dehydratase [Gammaproteobacteria bacterium]|mgnify:FL=1|jgi:chorismate mutase/prephenate dehydratase|nr:prephenate dehydratase [Gammaproteobacteria bacterium]MBT3859526.1 prephenate dehydratase [Gammaproteobacteria bacterium]MBT3986580.1 prephenate dehydratase [Gammaproteobacteria bacterium]MBT4659993.1 prephenate dehydratase [Gammaproteobacteria bacterium]MBT4891555.1 prephenate dehydratase [Gammaproteobacteria bacterium]
MSDQSDSNNLKTVAFLGPEGTFTHLAAMRHFDEGCQLLPCRSIEDVFVKVESKEATHGVVPIENSTEGAINNTQDCLVDSSLTIVGEELVLIRHNLLASSAIALNQIQKVASHKQSLAQCRNWLKNNLPAVEQYECISNAQAAKLALEEDGTVAIAGALAAETYGLEILNSDIQDQQHNSTRFLVLSHGETKSSGSDKTSLIVYMEHKPGSLLRVLEPFEKLGVNLNKIETRPSKKKAWAYVFFIDFDGHCDDENIRQLFSELDERTVEIKVLGSYPRGVEKK